MISLRRTVKKKNISRDPSILSCVGTACDLNSGEGWYGENASHRFNGAW